MSFFISGEKELPTAGESERFKHEEVSHEIMFPHQGGERLAPAHGQALFLAMN